MSIRFFRRLPRQERIKIIQEVSDPLAREIMTAAFGGYGRQSWVKVAMMIGGGNSPDGVRMIATRELKKL